MTSLVKRRSYLVKTLRGDNARASRFTLDEIRS